MGTRIAMACYDTVNKAANNAGMGGVDSYQAYSIYEAGMIDMLTQIAVLRLMELEGEGRRPYPPEHDKAVQDQADLIEKIRDTLPEEHKSLTSALEDVEQQLNIIEMDDQFIRGFVEGYRYLRNLNSSYRNPLLDVRK